MTPVSRAPIGLPCLLRRAVSADLVRAPPSAARRAFRHACAAPSSRARPRLEPARLATPRQTVRRSRAFAICLAALLPAAALAQEAGAPSTPAAEASPKKGTTGKEAPAAAAARKDEAAGREAAGKGEAKAKARKGEAAAKKGAAEAQPKELYATFVTSAGKIGVRLFPEQKPGAVKNFVELAEGKKEWTDPRTGSRSRKPLYDGTVFHRVIPGFMIQGGDPLGIGVGGPGYAIPDELQESERFFDQPCQLAYANSGPNSNGSQFFITEVPTLHLNPVKCDRSPSGLCGYVRFGEGVCGCDLVAKIAAAGNSRTTLEKVVVSRTRPTCQ